MRYVSGIAALVIASLSGCASTDAVRYVYQDADFGVIGLPENTDAWPTHYRTHAEALMKEHFPWGYEIVRAEEVDEGSRTLKVEGSTAAAISPNLTGAALNVGTLGHTASRSQLDTLKLKECRIIYRRTGGLNHPAGYADAAAPTPPKYLDPNEIERHKVDKPVQAVADEHAKGDKAIKPPPKPGDA